MQTVTVISGEVWEILPFELKNENEERQYLIDYPPIKAFYANGQTPLPDGEWEVELKDQYLHNGYKWVRLGAWCPTIEFANKQGIKTRQIYLSPEPSAKEDNTYQIPEYGMPLPPTDFKGKYGFPKTDLNFENPMAFVSSLGDKSSMNLEERLTLLDVLNMYLDGAEYQASKANYGWVKPTEAEITEMFHNRSDCYADAETPVPIPAMTLKGVLDMFKKLLPPTN